MFIETANPTHSFCLITAIFSIVDKQATFDHLMSANSIIKLLFILKDCVLGFVKPHKRQNGDASCATRVFSPHVCCMISFSSKVTRIATSKIRCVQKKSSFIAFSRPIIQTTNNKQQTTNNKHQTTDSSHATSYFDHV